MARRKGKRLVKKPQTTAAERIANCIRNNEFLPALAEMRSWAIPKLGELIQNERNKTEPNLGKLENLQRFLNRFMGLFDLALNPPPRSKDSCCSFFQVKPRSITNSEVCQSMLLFVTRFLEEIPDLEPVGRAAIIKFCEIEQAKAKRPNKAEIEEMVNLRTVAVVAQFSNAKSYPALNWLYQQLEEHDLEHNELYRDSENWTCVMYFIAYASDDFLKRFLKKPWDPLQTLSDSDWKLVFDTIIKQKSSNRFTLINNEIKRRHTNNSLLRFLASEIAHALENSNFSRINQILVALPKALTTHLINNQGTMIVNQLIQKNTASDFAQFIQQLITLKDENKINSADCLTIMNEALIRCLYWSNTAVILCILLNQEIEFNADTLRSLMTKCQRDAEEIAMATTAEEPNDDETRPTSDELLQYAEILQQKLTQIESKPCSTSDAIVTSPTEAADDVDNDSVIFESDSTDGNNTTEALPVLSMEDGSFHSEGDSVEEAEHGSLLTAIFQCIESGRVIQFDYNPDLLTQSHSENIKNTPFYYALYCAITKADSTLDREKIASEFIDNMTEFPPHYEGINADEFLLTLFKQHPNKANIILKLRAVLFSNRHWTETNQSTELNHTLVNDFTDQHFTALFEAAHFKTDLQVQQFAEHLLHTLFTTDEYAISAINAVLEQPEFAELYLRLNLDTGGHHRILILFQYAPALVNLFFDRGLSTECLEPICKALSSSSDTSDLILLGTIIDHIHFVGAWVDAARAKLAREEWPTVSKIILNYLHENFPGDALTIMASQLPVDAKFYLVGGALRDACFNITPKDWDILVGVATETMREALIALNKTHNIAFTELPIEDKKTVFNTTINGIAFDFTCPNQYDSDKKYHETHAWNADTTINSLTCKITLMGDDATHFKLKRPMHEKTAHDVLQRIIRFPVTNPHHRCHDEPHTKRWVDAKKCLRAIALASQIGGSIEPETFQLIWAYGPRVLHDLSIPERSTLFKKLFGKQNAADSFRYLDECGLLQVIFPGLNHVDPSIFIPNLLHELANIDVTNTEAIHQIHQLLLLTVLKFDPMVKQNPSSLTEAHIITLSEACYFRIPPADIDQAVKQFAHLPLQPTQ